jgi:wyosine [tRNA(Phe)-imidazoG37] synthetase (radical SAM superfamily)
MRDKEKENANFNNKSTVYGPVKSWRFGMSLGIDPIYHLSTCSFNCIYCQLGNIQDITTNFKEYVSTDQVINDYKKFLLENKKHDLITYSGSGEPTLASNLSEMVTRIKEISPEVPQAVLTNGTEIHQKEVRANLLNLDKIIFKLDASSDEMLQKINRPANGVTLEKIIEGFELLKKDFSGELEVQTMFMPINETQLKDYANILNKLKPDLVQLNTPKRPYPLEWHKENRGNHKKIFDYETRSLKTVGEDMASDIENYLRSETGLEILSIYR